MKIKKSKLKKIVGKTETVRFKITSKSKTIGDKDMDRIYDLSANGITINVEDEDYGTPMAFDASFEIKGNLLVIEGGVDTNGFGSCVIKLPKTKANNYYIFEADFARNEEDALEIGTILKKYGYEVM